MATIQNLLDEARLLLQDSRTPYRYTDDVLVPVLNRALQELNRIRPDAFFDTFDDVETVVPVLTTADLATNFPVAMMYYAPVLYYVVGAVELSDDEFAVEGRASVLLSRFTASVLTPQ